MVYNMKYIENSSEKAQQNRGREYFYVRREKQPSTLTLEKRHLRTDTVNDAMYRLLGQQWSLQNCVKLVTSLTTSKHFVSVED